MQNNNDYRKGFEDGIRACAKSLIKYYETLGSNTYGYLVAYTIDLKVKEMLEGSEKHENNGGF
jgi:hypothetical protein